MTETTLLTERRHAGDRRQSRTGNVTLAPHRIERRTGLERRLGAAVLAGAMTAALTPATVSAGSAANPLYGAALYVAPNSPAKLQADQWRAKRRKDARQMDKIAAQAQAIWFGNWSGDVAAAVDRTVTPAASAGRVPVLVAYNIPNRDCGSFSAGGAGDGFAYRQWIEAFARGIRDRRAIVILEPDALAMASDCGTAAQQQERYDLLYDAISALKSNPATHVYVDAGNSGWLTPAVMAPRLDAVGIHRADGVALNTSNFRTSTAEVSFGSKLSQLLGGIHFVVDTSRNGLGPGSTWCNPTGRALGPKPSTKVTHALVDAYLWVKRPGESDGTCNGGPSAGSWWADYALGLARRAAY